MPEAAEETARLVQAVLQYSLLVVPVSQQGVSKVIVVRLNDFNRIGEVLVEICFHVPAHAPALPVKPVRATNVVHTTTRKTIVKEGSGAPVDLVRGDLILKSGR